MSDTTRPLALWRGAAGAGAGYLALFLLARRPTAIRLGRIGWASGLLAAARIGLVAAGSPLRPGSDTLCFGAALVAGVALRRCGRVWLARAAAPDLHEQIRSTCRGLFLQCDEPAPGRFRLTSRGLVDELQVRKVSTRTQLLILPRTAPRTRTALLIQWLSKQYPGPLPRIHRDLTRSRSA